GGEDLDARAGERIAAIVEHAAGEAARGALEAQLERRRVGGIELARGGEIAGGARLEAHFCGDVIERELAAAIAHRDGAAGRVQLGAGERIAAIVDDAAVNRHASLETDLDLRGR